MKFTILKSLALASLALATNVSADLQYGGFDILPATAPGAPASATKTLQLNAGNTVAGNLSGVTDVRICTEENADSCLSDLAENTVVIQAHAENIYSGSTTYLYPWNLNFSNVNVSHDPTTNTLQVNYDYELWGTCPINQPTQGQCPFIVFDYFYNTEVEGSTSENFVFSFNDGLFVVDKEGINWIDLHIISPNQGLMNYRMNANGTDSYSFDVGAQVPFANINEGDTFFFFVTYEFTETGTAFDDGITNNYVAVASFSDSLTDDEFLDLLVDSGYGRCSVELGTPTSTCDFYIKTDGQSYSFALNELMPDVLINFNPQNTGCSDTWAKHISVLTPVSPNRDNTIQIARFLQSNGICD